MSANTELDWEVSRKWCHREAYRIAPPASSKAHMHEDLVQEGLIAMHRALETFDPSKGGIVSYCQRAATMRMHGLAWGRNLPLSTERHPVRDASGRADLLRLDKPIRTSGRDEGGEDITLGHVVLTDDDADLIHAVTLAYHRGDLRAALDRLEPQDREYVVRRFWHGETGKVIAADLGVSMSRLSERWTTKIRPRLARELAHLAEVA